MGKKLTIPANTLGKRYIKSKRHHTKPNTNTRRIKSNPNIELATQCKNIWGKVAVIEVNLISNYKSEYLRKTFAEYATEDKPIGVIVGELMREDAFLCRIQLPTGKEFLSIGDDAKAVKLAVVTETLKAIYVAQARAENIKDGSVMGITKISNDEEYKQCLADLDLVKGFNLSSENGIDAERLSKLISDYELEVDKFALVTETLKAIYVTQARAEGINDGSVMGITKITNDEEYGQCLADHDLVSSGEEYNRLSKLISDYELEMTASVTKLSEDKVRQDYLHGRLLSDTITEKEGEELVKLDAALAGKK